MKLSVIDNYDSFVYNLVRYLRETKGVTEVVVMRNDNIDQQSLETSAGILLSPGPGIPQEAGHLMEVIEKFAGRKSMLGVCLGHQALGEYFGARLEKAPTIYHGKSTPIRVDADATLFNQLNAEIHVGRYHSWQIAELPPQLKATGFDAGDNVMAFEHTDYAIHGVQFHPESILTPDGRTIITNWINSLQ
jgi:anthranilate synthase component 2